MRNLKERISISDAQLKDELVKLFESGNTDKGNCWEYLRTKFKIQRQRFYKTFNQVLIGWQELREKARTKQVQANATDALKSAVMSKQERLETLTKIAKGELKVKRPFVIGGKIMEYPSEPDAMERKAAIAEMNKMEGDYAPSKVAQTDSKGNDVEQRLTKEQIDALIEKL